MSASPEACPQCSSARALPIAYGSPTKETMERSRLGEVSLGGCMVHGPDGVEKDPAFVCRACGHRFGVFDWSKVKTNG